MMTVDRRFPPNWSKAKDGLYFREWAAVKRADKFADRHELHRKALGKDKSHIAFTDNDFTKVLGVFRAISRPDDLISQVDALEGRKMRLMFGIRRTAQKLNVGEAYIGAIVEKQLGRKSDLEQLNEDQLENVRIAMSLHFRRAMAKKAEIQSELMPF